MFSAITQAVRRRSDFLARIDRPVDWMTVSERHGRHTVARTETVKFVIDLHDDGRTYFLNSSRWFSHYDFVQRFINPRVDYKRFIIAEYTREDRRFVLGSVMHRATMQSPLAQSGRYLSFCSSVPQWRI